jgi:uncharacterized protein (TIRG00374 family)
MKSAKKKNWFWLRLLLSAIIIYFLLRMVEIERLAALLAAAKFSFLFLTWLLGTIEMFLVAYRWKVILGIKKIKTDFWTIAKLYFAGNFVGTFVPSGLGGDIFRAYGLYKKGADPSQTISSIFVERIISLLSSLVVACAGVLLYYKLMHDSSVLQSVWITVSIFGAFLLAIMNKTVMQFFFNCFRILKLQRIQSYLEKVYAEFIDYHAHKPKLLYILIISFLFQFVRVLVTYAGSLALNQNVDLVYFFIFVPLIVLVSLLPISVGGIGVREGAFVYFFSQVGMSTAEAFTLSLLLYVLNLIVILPGGVIYAAEGLALKEAPPIKEAG